MTSTLKSLNFFLRKIGNSTKLDDDGVTLRYAYDIGDTTELLITIVGISSRPKQRKAIRLLGRNEPLHYVCQKCKASAASICCECVWAAENPFFCESCLQEHPPDSVLPVVNSPRMGVCGYSGEFDVCVFGV